MKLSISIVIPVLNESETIVSLLEHLEQKVYSLDHIADIIIVDGGSTDRTTDLVGEYSKKHPKVQLVTSKRGRALQMNTGAKKALGSILYFLHADSFPPQGYDKLIIDQVALGNPAGCFKMKFDYQHWWLRLMGWFTQFKWRACRGGDQSQFITQQLFQEIGTFDERFVVYEDNDLINKLYAKGTYVVIQSWLTTSARRYKENGVWKLQFYFLNIYIRKWLGASAEDLHKYYLKKVN